MTGIGALTCFLIIVPTFRMRARTPSFDGVMCSFLRWFDFFFQHSF